MTQFLTTASLQARSLQYDLNMTLMYQSWLLRHSTASRMISKMQEPFNAEPSFSKWRYSASDSVVHWWTDTLNYSQKVIQLSIFLSNFGTSSLDNLTPFLVNWSSQYSICDCSNFFTFKDHLNISFSRSAWEIELAILIQTTDNRSF